MIWHVQNENFILDSTRIFMKAFHLLLFDGSFIFPEYIPWLYFISSTSLVMSITALLFRWREEPMISFSGNFQTNNFNEIFQFLILLCSTLCIPLSVEYIECTEMALTEFLLFVLTATLGGMFLCGANDLITIFVAPECFSLCSYLLSGYTKKDVRSNEATTKYLLMGGTSSSILVHGFSWLYGSSGGEIELQEIVNGLINTQMYNSPGISIALIFITVGIGFKLSPAPSHQWTPDVYEGVRFVREIPTSLSISEMFGFFKTPWTCRREMLSPLGPRHNFYFGFSSFRDYECNRSIRRQKDHPKMIISWLLRTNQIRWFYFSIFLTCSYGIQIEKIEKISHSQPLMKDSSKIVAFLSVTSKVAASASATRIFDIPLYFSSNEWHLLLEILAILSMILGNLIAITQTSMKRMLAYSSIGQLGYVIIGIIVGDSNDGYASMITYMLFYISMNLGTFACIVLFGLRTGTDNIRDYAGLYTKDPFLAISLALCLLSLGGLPPLAGFFGKLYLFWCGWQAGLYSLLLMTGRNQEITPHVQNYRRSPLRSKNSIELSMIVCVIASTIPGISMNPIIAIAQDTLF
ncbi:hypothetical protein RND81_O342400 [Saponaria officinalis]|uniref:NADH-plastoquinone oxidoreductase subunit 2 n=1 Tax=Saponaria officinalis TaxID=3572 RepID=A0AAW1GHB3_SAPOF